MEITALGIMIFVIVAMTSLAIVISVMTEDKGKKKEKKDVK